MMNDVERLRLALKVFGGVPADDVHPLLDRWAFSQGPLSGHEFTFVKNDVAYHKTHLEAARNTLREMTDILAASGGLNGDQLLFALDRDVLRAKIVTELDSIPIEEAVCALTYLRDLSASATEIELNHIESLGTISDSALQIAQSYRFGHTFRGSFGFIVEYPFDINSTEAPSHIPGHPGSPSTTELSEKPPIQRKVLRRLAKGLDHIARAVNDGSPAIVVDNSNEGCSGSMCKIIQGIIEKFADQTFVFEPIWSPTIFANDVIRRVLLESNERTYSIVHEAARQLSPPDLPLWAAEDATVRYIEKKGTPLNVDGIVISLNARDALDDPEQQRTIIVEGTSPITGRKIKVKVYLNPFQYRDAIEAHRLGTSVRVVGAVTKRGRGLIIKECTHLIRNIGVL